MIATRNFDWRRGSESNIKQLRSKPSQLPAAQASALVPQCFKPSHRDILAARTISEGVATISNPTPNYCGTIILLELLLEVEFNENVKLLRAVGVLEI
jgi:hypothetical protein